MLSLEEVTPLEHLNGLNIELGDADICINSITFAVLRNDPAARWIATPSWLRFKVNTETVADVDYIRFLLLTSEVQKACHDISSGMGMTTIKAEALLALRVPQHSREEQLQIARERREQLDDIKRSRLREKVWVDGLSSSFLKSTEHD